MLNILKDKKFPLILLLLSVGLYILVEMMWGTCPEVDCSHQLIDNWLRTIGTGSVYLALYAGFFLFLPTHYFTSWFKYIFSWAFPLTVYLTYITVGSSSVPAYGKVDIVRFWGLAYAVITLLFVLYMYIRMRKMK